MRNKKYLNIILNFIYAIVGMLIYKYLKKIFFNIDFSLLVAITTGIAGGIGYLFVLKNKK